MTSGLRKVGEGVTARLVQDKDVVALRDPRPPNMTRMRRRSGSA